MAIQAAADEVLFFIADLSGFTKFVAETEIQHSQHIIKELLEILVDANTLGMKVSEFEGDAVFVLPQRRAAVARAVGAAGQEDVPGLSYTPEKIRVRPHLPMRCLHRRQRHCIKDGGAFRFRGHHAGEESPEVHRQGHHHRAPPAGELG